MGVMLAMLGGNSDSVAAFKACVGKTIAKVVMSGEALRFEFTDETAMELFDDGQSCCESRYMTCDEDFASYVGATLMDAEVCEAPSRTSEGGEDHDCAFLRVTTSAGILTCETHVEHNGYYGGFALRARAA
jgi:hypothetical protein